MGQLNDMRKELNELCKTVQAPRQADADLSETLPLRTCADAPQAANTPGIAEAPGRKQR